MRPYAWRLMLRGSFNKCQARYTLPSLPARRLAVRPMYYQDVGTVVLLSMCHDRSYAGKSFTLAESRESKGLQIGACDA